MQLFNHIHIKPFCLGRIIVSRQPTLGCLIYNAVYSGIILLKIKYVGFFSIPNSMTWFLLSQQREFGAGLFVFTNVRKTVFLLQSTQGVLSDTGTTRKTITSPSNRPVKDSWQSDKQVWREIRSQGDISQSMFAWLPDWQIVRRSLLDPLTWWKGNVLDVL